jgi:hypothetical protein
LGKIFNPLDVKEDINVITTEIKTAAEEWRKATQKPLEELVEKFKKIKEISKAGGFLDFPEVEQRAISKIFDDFNESVTEKKELEVEFHKLRRNLSLNTTQILLEDMKDETKEFEALVGKKITAQELASVRAKLEAKIRKDANEESIILLEDFNIARERLTLNATNFALRQFEREIKGYEKLVQEGKLGAAELEQFKINSIQRIQAQNSTFWNNMIQGANQFSDDVTDAFADFMETGEFAFQSLATDFARMINKMVAQALVIQPIMDFLFGSGGGGKATGFGVVGNYLFPKQQPQQTATTPTVTFTGSIEEAKKFAESFKKETGEMFKDFAKDKKGMDRMFESNMKGLTKTAETTAKDMHEGFQGGFFTPMREAFSGLLGFVTSLFSSFDSRKGGFLSGVKSIFSGKRIRHEEGIAEKVYSIGIKPDKINTNLQTGGVLSKKDIDRLGGRSGFGSSGQNGITVNVPVSVEGGNNRLAGALQKNIEQVVIKTVRELS